MHARLVPSGVRICTGWKYPLTGSVGKPVWNACCAETMPDSSKTPIIDAQNLIAPRRSYRQRAAPIFKFSAVLHENKCFLCIGLPSLPFAWEKDKSITKWAMAIAMKPLKSQKNMGQKKIQSGWADGIDFRYGTWYSLAVLIAFSQLVLILYGK